MEKATIKQCLTLATELRNIKDRTVKATGAVIEGVKIPAEKSKAGYWLGRLEDKISSIEKSYLKQREELLKQLGIKEEVEKEVKGEKKMIPTGNYLIPDEKAEEFNSAIEAILEIKEETLSSPIEYELLEGIAFPQSFWTAIIPFVTEPK